MTRHDARKYGYLDLGPIERVHGAGTYWVAAGAGS